MLTLVLFALISTVTTAAENYDDSIHRPPAFAYQDGQAQFVDFKEANYSIDYDLSTRSAVVRAQIKFVMVEEGYPIFDLIEEPSSLTLDGIQVSAPNQQTPNRETTVRVINQKIAPGEHTLNVNVPLKTLVNFTERGVKNAFWVTDLKDRFYLERFIPCNLEYDRVKMIFDIHFKGLQAPQHVMANGQVSWLDNERARVEFPDYFTVNSLYYHTTPVGSLDMVNFTFTSMTGKEIPVVIYEAKDASEGLPLSVYQEETLKVLTELEADYGAFLHPSVTIYIADLSGMGLGGMEYAGATVTDYYSLGHELFHSYFARGVVPANGNAGWIDEALASWRDRDYLQRNQIFGQTSMAAHPIYTRETDTRAYSFGPQFMGWLDHNFASQGGMKPFMRHLLATKLFTPITTEEFVSLMEEYYQNDQIGSWFINYIYGGAVSKSKSSGQIPKVEEHPIHRKMGLAELYRIL